MFTTSTQTLALWLRENVVFMSAVWSCITVFVTPKPCETSPLRQQIAIPVWRYLLCAGVPSTVDWCGFYCRLVCLLLSTGVPSTVDWCGFMFGSSYLYTGVLRSRRSTPRFLSSINLHDSKDGSAWFSLL